MLIFCPNYQMSHKHNSSLTDELILRKIYTIAIYDLMMCIKKENPGPKYFKGNS